MRSFRFSITKERTTKDCFVLSNCPLPNCQLINTTAIRYSFNGKEDEIFSEWQDYGFRNYDKRQRRFTSVDPLTAKYPWYTPYQFAGNKVIQAVDLDGLEEYEVTYELNGSMAYISLIDADAVYKVTYFQAVHKGGRVQIFNGRTSFFPQHAEIIANSTRIEEGRLQPIKGHRGNQYKAWNMAVYQVHPVEDEFNFEYHDGFISESDEFSTVSLNTTSEGQTKLFTSFLTTDYFSTRYFISVTTCPTPECYDDSFTIQEGNLQMTPMESSISGSIPNLSNPLSISHSGTATYEGSRDALEGITVTAPQKSHCIVDYKASLRIQAVKLQERNPYE